MAKKKSKVEEKNEEAAPICEKCGNALIEENKELVCPHCQGEIDFFGDDDE